MLTIAKLKWWSINYYIDTARTSERAATDGVVLIGGGRIGSRRVHPTWYESRDIRKK
jgi:hypothetical protein